MVKRTALSNRSKKRNLRNRKKNQKSCRRALRKSNCNRSDHKTCHLSENTSVLEPPVVQMDTITLKDNIEDVTGNGPIVQSDICDLQKEADLTVISINDTVVDEGSNTGLDTSCFIIDVEPNQNSNETGGFYEYKNPFESGREDETEESKRPDPDSNPCAVSGDGSLQSSGISGENERFVTVCNNNDTSMDSAHLTDKSNSASGDDVSNTNDSSDASNSAVKTLNAPAVALFNNIVDRMKRDGFFGKKRKRLDNGPGNSKRYFNDSKNSPLIDKYFSDLDKSKRTKWESFKKKTDGVVGAAVSSANDPSQISRPSDQSLLRDYLNTGCICVDDSDSDVEFVEEYNPSDRLIELSDGEESVIIEEEISLPKKKRKNRKTPAKGNKQTANHYNTRQNKARLIDTGNAEKTRDSEKHVPTADCALRPIVIDGCNVGMGHSRSKVLSVKGIKICYDYFHERGHDIKIFLPQSKKFSVMTTDWNMLDKMEKEGSVIFTPARRVNGKQISSYDDRFILEYAALKGAIIITRDNYRDLYDEREDFRETIRDRLLQYTFVEDLIMFPDDPLGRNGPRLNQFLRFPPNQPGTTKPS